MLLRIEWADEALQDLERLVLFQLVHNGERAAQGVAQGLYDFVEQLPLAPRVWRQLRQFDGDVRRALWSRYEVRYEVDEGIGVVRVVRLFEQREDREV
ncbi:MULTISPECIES: type II toxin-antitoxin system RelE/ParE family toxin [Paraburkholderia]|uniref:type II toxin-antitoxin system RelE/ParE family toxin n=1 Tax=Paraburkholderia TaxID=1822464 RepID=UPI0009F23431|nr:type II toxin-antitoxin system RelE/ParE family toxin [Paraburkholderia nodosa]